MQMQLRERMAKAAADMVQDGSVVILDVAPEAALIARNLRGHKVIILTSNLAVLDQVRDDDAVDLVLIGGAVRHHHDSLVGPLAERMITDVAADLMFLCCTGVRGNAVVDDMAVEAPVRQGFIKASQQIVLLADEFKFPGTGSFRLCSLTDLNALVTTSGSRKGIQDSFAKDGKKVVVV